MHSVLSPGVRVHSYCEVDNSILLSNARIGRYSRLRRTIVDSGVCIPESSVIGFDAASDRANMEMAFPSKLADYTATGVPLLIYGPSYCSAIAWARENPGVAELVENEPDLAPAIELLATNPDHRIALGKRALDSGREYFTHARVQQRFHQSLSG